MISNLCRKAIAEFIGTFAMVFAGCGAIMVHSLYPDALPAVAIAPVFGLAVAAMIYATGHISGAHFNPAVTLAFAIVKRFSWKEIPAYWAAQCLASLAAVSLLAAILPDAGTYGATLPSLPLLQSFIWEAVLTFFLMFVIIAVATDGRAVGIMAGAAIGATVILAAFVGGPLTGASMNPARSLGPALVSGELTHLWLYLLAPAIGAVTAALVYEAIRCEPNQPKTKAGGCC